MTKAIRPIIVLVVLLSLALLILLAAKRRSVTAEEAFDDAVQSVVKLERTVERDEFAVIAFASLLALVGFVFVTVLDERQGKAETPARASEASSTKTP